MLRRVVIGTVGNAIAIWAAARIVGHVDLSHSWWTVAGAALILTLLNAYVKPVVRLLALPLVLLTLGIARFLISMLMLWLTSALVSGFRIDGFWPLVKATVIVWLVNVVFAAIFDPDDDPQRRGGRRQPTSPAAGSTRSRQ
jgi:putative membrane protein